MGCEALDKQFFAEVRDLNITFLDLVVDPLAGEAGMDMLGLAPESAEVLRALDAAERRRMAAVPVPFAGFRNLPLSPRVAEPPTVPPGLHPAWLLTVSLFAAGLLTYLWQLARHQPVAARLCVGPGRGWVQRLADLGFDTIQSCVPLATPLLEARCAFSPALLTPLLRAARSPGPERRAVGLDLIPLGLAGLRPSRVHRRRV